MIKNIKKILLIAKWEFKEKFLHKAFIISFLLSQFLLVFAFYFIKLDKTEHSTDVIPIAVVSENNNNNLISKKLNYVDNFVFINVNKSKYLDSLNNFSVQKLFLEKDFLACIILNNDNINLVISSDLNKNEIVKIQNFIYNNLNLTSTFITSLINVNNLALEDKILKKIGVVLIFIFTILISSNLFIRGFAVEKESKLLEILFSSTTPANVIYGKSIGFLIFILAQLIIWLVFGFITNNILIYEIFTSINLLFIMLLQVLFYIVFFAIASLLSKHESDSNLILSITVFLLLLPFLFLDKLLSVTNSTVKLFLTLFPFTSFPAIVIKSINQNIFYDEVLFIILILITSISLLIYFITKFINSGTITKNLLFSYKKKNKQ